jgi:hypothetical protein
VVCSYEHGNWSSGAMKCAEFNLLANFSKKKRISLSGVRFSVFVGHMI